VELLVMLVVIGLRVEVTIDNLDHPLGVLELHLLLVIALKGNVLLAFPLAGRRSITVGVLLLLLVELLDVVAPRVMHQASWPTLITAEGLACSLVAAWTAALTSHYCDSDGSGSACQQLVVVELRLLPILVLSNALSSNICFGLASLPYLRGRLGVP
jgi:hypothetical protein